MYGCFDGVIILGFAQGDRAYVLDPEYMDENFGFDGFYALDVVRGHGGEAVYGVEADLKPDGTIVVSDEDKARVEKAYKALSKYRKVPPIQYHLAVYGDMESCWAVYTPETEIPPWDDPKAKRTKVDSE